MHNDPTGLYPPGTIESLNESIGEARWAMHSGGGAYGGHVYDNHWARGILQFSDWSPVTGSQNYRSARGAGAVDKGGILYWNGERRVEERHGEVMVPTHVTRYKTYAKGGKQFTLSVRNELITLEQAVALGLLAQNGGTDYQSMLNEALTDPELARFYELAPNTEFAIANEGPYFNPRAEPISGDKSKKGPARVTLPDWAFDSPELLFTVLGHELIHATHYESGSYARWYHEYGFDSEGALFAKFISEVYAYKWSAPYVEQYGLGDRIGGYNSYEKYLKRTPDSYQFPK